MRAVIQRVDKASVLIDGADERRIGKGVMVLIGIEADDNLVDVQWLAQKIFRLRIFNDSNSVMNLSLEDIGGDVMVISQFTLHAKTKKGNRPSYIKAAPPEVAIPLYHQFIKEIELCIKKQVITGEFGAHMEVSLVNNGPVTIIIDTKNKE